MTAGQVTGYQVRFKFSPTCFPKWEQQALVRAGIQVILLVRLVALVSNRPSALDLPCLPVYLFSWALVRASACITVGEVRIVGEAHAETRPFSPSGGEDTPKCWLLVGCHS